MYFQQLIPIGSQIGVMTMGNKGYIYVIPEQYLEEFEEMFTENQDTEWEAQLQREQLTRLQDSCQLRAYQCYFFHKIGKYPETFECRHLTSIIPITAQIINVT